MHKSLRSILTIIRTDILFRFRRTAAVVTMLIVAAAVYFIVPDLSTGKTLIEINNGRVLYTSAAVALGTAMFCSLFLSLVGFYLVSNSFRRDILTRTGFVVASTSVTNTEYIVGKFFGNLLYLTAVMLTCMLSSMVMFLIRGEASLEPLVFLSIYVWLVMPAIMFASAIALTFEALPLLSGRFGDVMFFFVWAATLGVLATILDDKTGPRWVIMFDTVGIVPIMEFMQEHFHTTTMSIGSTTFDASKAPVLFYGIPWSWNIVGSRLTSLFLPAVCLVLARLWFHRFNPTRIKFSVRHAKRDFFGRLNNLLKPATRILQPFAAAGGSNRDRSSLAGAVRADVVATLSLSPFAIVAIVVFAVLSLTLDGESIRAGVLPALVVALVITLADIATRDRAAGMMNLLFTAPKLKVNYVAWKFLSALVIVFCFTLIPIVRLWFAFPNSALSLLIGSFFFACSAIGFGIIARSQKTYIALFLMLLYIALNAKDTPEIDFAGFYGHATAGVHIAYAVLSLMLILAAHARHTRQFRTKLSPTA